MLDCKPKQHLKQQSGLNYLTNFEMTHLEFSVTIQCHETTFCVSCSRMKNPTGSVSSWYIKNEKANWLGMFSDKGNFQVFRMDSSITRLPSSDQFDPRFKVPTVKHQTPRFSYSLGAFSGEMGRPRAGFYFLPKN